MWITFDDPDGHRAIGMLRRGEREFEVDGVKYCEAENGLSTLVSTTGFPIVEPAVMAKVYRRIA